MKTLGMLAVTAVTAYAQQNNTLQSVKLVDSLGGCPRAPDSDARSYSSLMDEADARKLQISLLEKKLKSARRCEKRWQEELDDLEGQKNVDYNLFLITDEMRQKEQLISGLDLQIESLESGKKDEKSIELSIE